MLENIKTKYEMAKLDIEQKLLFQQEKLKLISKELKKDQGFKNSYTIIAMVVYHLSIIELYFEQNDIYMSFYQRNSEPILDKIRKEFSSIFSLTGDFFGRKIPNNLTENSSAISELEKFTPKRILNLVTKMDLLYDKLKLSYGLKSRYLNNLANMYGDMCSFILNIIDFKQYFNRIRDIADEEYLYIKNLLDFISNFLIKVADNYMETHNITDSKTFVADSIEILSFTEIYFRMRKDNRLSEVIRKKQTWERLLN
ncbi:MAG: hypothetical protein ACRCVW_02785 [Brevinema sp.]